MFNSKRQEVATPNHHCLSVWASVFLSVSVAVAHWSGVKLTAQGRPLLTWLVGQTDNNAAGCTAGSLDVKQQSTAVLRAFICIVL